MSFTVFENETLEDLQINNLFLIQKKDAFRFGMDAVLLANFARAKPGSKVIDLGTGTGIIPLLLSTKTKAKSIMGIEIQPEIAEMAERSVQGNGLSDRIQIQKFDIRECRQKLSTVFDVVVTNPPYTKIGGGIVNPMETKAMARHEILCTLSDVIRTASELLKYHGEFYMVHRPDRLCDIMVEMRSFKLEPKELRLVCPREGETPSLILIKGLNKGNAGMKLLPPLNIYDVNGNYSDETRIYYER